LVGELNYIVADEEDNMEDKQNSGKASKNAPAIVKVALLDSDAEMDD
jgi:hypothetical protein